MSIYGDSIFETTYDLDKLINLSNKLISESYEFDTMINSIDESFGDAVKAACKKFVEFIKKIIEFIKKIGRAVRDNFIKLKNKLFTKANTKMMEKSIETMYNTCPRSDEPLDKIEAEFNKLANILKIDRDIHLSMLYKLDNYVIGDYLGLIISMKNNITLYNNNESALNAIVSFIEKLISCFPNVVPAHPSPDLVKESIKREDSIDKYNELQVLAVQNFNNIAIWKELIRLAMDSKVLNDLDESVIITETIEKGFDNSDFKDRVYNYYKFPAVKDVEFPKVHSNISQFDTIFNASAEDLKNTEKMDRKIVEILDLKGLFNEVKSVKKAIESNYSTDWIDNIANSISVSAWEEIYFPTKDDARKYYLKISLEKAIRAVHLMEYNASLMSDSISKVYANEYSNELSKLQKQYEHGNSKEIRNITLKREYISKTIKLVNAVTTFQNNYTKTVHTSGFGLITFIRAMLKGKSFTKPIKI